MKPSHPPAHPAWARVEACLERRKAAIYDEIGAYPPPIPACDAQFNHLLEQRSGIHREIGRMRAARDEGPGDADPGARVEAFIAASQYIEESDREALRRALRGGRDPALG